MNTTNNTMVADFTFYHMYLDAQFVFHPTVTGPDFYFTFEQRHLPNIHVTLLCDTFYWWPYSPEPLIVGYAEYYPDITSGPELQA